MTIKDYKAATEELRSTVIELRWLYMSARVDAGIASPSERFRVMMGRVLLGEWLANRARVRFNLPL